MVTYKSSGIEHPSASKAIFRLKLYRTPLEATPVIRIVQTYQTLSKTSATPITYLHKYVKHHANRHEHRCSCRQHYRGVERRRFELYDLDDL